MPGVGLGAPAHPVPQKSESGGSAGVVLAAASSAGEHEAEQSAERALGELAARTATGLQADYGRLSADLCVARVRAVSVKNTLRESQEPIFHFVNTVFFLKALFSACFLENLTYAAL